MPNYYRPMFPGGPKGPLRWQDEQSGVLPKAVLAWFAHRANAAQLTLVIAYACYYMDAPCWDWNPHSTDEDRAVLAELRARVKTFTPEMEPAFDRWLRDCLDIGIDVL